MKFDQSLKHLNWYNATNKMIAKHKSCIITMEDEPVRANKISAMALRSNDFFYQLGVTCSLVDILIDIGNSFGIDANNLPKRILQNKIVEVLKDLPEKKRIILYRFNQSEVVNLSILIRLIIELEGIISFILIIVKDSIKSLLQSNNPSFKLLQKLISEKYELL